MAFDMASVQGDTLMVLSRHWLDGLLHSCVV